ncbi:MarR family winged helix-turn-helix transcriptional regulator [Sphingobacterium yanglingense]|uniref:MarR family transcriptional regulator n=1 Tax=Sphingobacterium yanglingense TaxID=1437280 RepID=A0A4R6WJP3_9SPHI|nr:MarR family winged helix-turn-helix transcriptional regulator [Sphingobacterium yanglingense]TDQ77950.1 MarR family transcriptional regulator [Sphingobacterium yanglingense]
MKYNLMKDVIGLLEEFEKGSSESGYPQNIQGFQRWVSDKSPSNDLEIEPSWVGKEKGRSADSAISTMLVHMNRYAKSYSKSAISGSPFSTQEEFIYLINLQAFGAMTKMELIKRNIHEKPVGMQTINRLIHQGWVSQIDSSIDKRSKVVMITEEGIKILNDHMGRIRQATSIVTGNLTNKEKMDLIKLLSKLNDFHHALYMQSIDNDLLLDVAYQTYKEAQSTPA